jgi:hypothetical protein
VGAAAARRVTLLLAVGTNVSLILHFRIYRVSQLAIRPPAVKVLLVKAAAPAAR